MAIVRPKLKFFRGKTYTIDLSDSSMATHPIRFTADSGVSEYTHGITVTGTQGQAGAKVAWNIPDSAPDNMMYYCTTHGIAMGQKIKIVWLVEPAATGTRGMAIGGKQPGNSNIMQYFDITSTGNAQDFGDLTTSDANASAGGNGSRGVRIGGDTNNTTIDYWTFSTLGNAIDFGDPLVARNLATTVADGTKAITAGSVVGGYKNDIEYITVATTGNGTDFGDLTRSTAGISSTSDKTRGVFAGDQNLSTNAMEYITMLTPGNAIDYGDLATNGNNMLQGIVSDNTYGVFMAGVVGGSYSNVVQYMTIQSSSNALDFGDLAQARAYGGQTSDAASKRGVAMGGYYNPGGLTFNSMEYITINTPGNALDFGDLTGNNERNAGVSGAAA